VTKKEKVGGRVGGGQGGVLGQPGKAKLPVWKGNSSDKSGAIIPKEKRRVGREYFGVISSWKNLRGERKFSWGD